MVKPLHVANAAIWNGSGYAERDLYTTDVVLAERPADALTVDLSGCTIFPGLINAHDHLARNHFPRTKFRQRYDNASQWSADVNAHLSESSFRELRAYPVEDQLFIGGLKNLLCGATTVVHHDAPHKALFRRDFPVRVLKRCGWAHSLYLWSEEQIVASYRRTPPDAAWFIHLAEGVDDYAKGEYRRLKALGCIGSNTVIVHGVGLTDEDIADAAPRVRGLVWCPTSNRYLLGETASISAWRHAGGRLALGSDSRLTADGDLLDELRAARALFDDFPQILFRGNAFLTGIEALYGCLKVGAPADWIAVPRPKTILDLCRVDLALVVRGGEPQIGDPEIMAKFPHVETVRARLDDKEKSVNVKLARQIARCTLKQAGLELLEAAPIRRWKDIWTR